MRYAAEELGRQWENVRGLRRFVSSIRIAIACVTASERLVHPRAYGAVGLDIGNMISNEMLDGLRNTSVTRLFIDPSVDPDSGDVHGQILRLAPLT